MDFTTTREQEALRDTARAVFAEYDPRLDPSRRRAVTTTDPGYAPDVWRRCAQTGLLGVGFAEKFGGGGAGPIEVGIVAEELGRMLAPEPFVLSCVLVGTLIDLAGRDDQRERLLTALVSGDLIATHATTSGPIGGRVAGEPVLHAATADLVVWQWGDSLHVCEDLETVTSHRTPDGGRAGRAEVSTECLTRLGRDSDATAAIVRAHAMAQIAACHEAVGAMDTALNLTRTYLTERRQFGVTLSSFQDLTFRAADCYGELELTRSLVGWASMVAAETDDLNQLVDAAKRAKLRTATASRRVAEESIQLHGGIGMTAEHPVGNYAARLAVLGQWLGSAHSESAALIARVGDHGVLDPIA